MALLRTDINILSHTFLNNVQDYSVSKDSLQLLNIKTCHRLQVSNYFLLKRFKRITERL